MKTYLVGGAVRDTLLGRDVYDRDWVVVGASEADMRQLGYSQVGSDFPVFLHPQSKEEYALARTESKNGKGYNGFSVNAMRDVTLEQDLLRRDLTINAMAMDDSGSLIDPYGGQADLKQRILRHVSPAFSEDPLRVLRVARFAARYQEFGFCIAPETMELMRAMTASGELDALTPERVWKETSRALLESKPHVYFETLRECGALDVWFPEIAILWGIPNPPKWHPEIDTGIHTMMVLEQSAKLTDNLAIRYAALVHDLGKGLTDPNQWPSHRGHELLGLAPINALSDRMRVPNDCRELALLMSEYHSAIHRVFDLPPEIIVTLFQRTDAWRRPERFDQLLVTCKADARGRTGFEHIDYEQMTYLQNCLTLAKEVDVQAIIAQGYTGTAIKTQLDKERVDLIRRKHEELHEVSDG